MAAALHAQHPKQLYRQKESNRTLRGRYGASFQIRRNRQANGDSPGLDGMQCDFVAMTPELMLSTIAH